MPKGSLDEALSRLSETQRSLVMLKDYEGYNYAEIGQITGLNEKPGESLPAPRPAAVERDIVKPENVI